MNFKLIEKLLSKIKCRSCGKQCEPDNTNILGGHKDMWFFTTYCSSCDRQSMVVVVVDKNKELELATELTEAEQTKFDKPVSLDDVIDIRVFLDDFSGDFFSLFDLMP